MNIMAKLTKKTPSICQIPENKDMVFFSFSFSFFWGGGGGLGIGVLFKKKIGRGLFVHIKTLL